MVSKKERKKKRRKRNKEINRNQKHTGIFLEPSREDSSQQGFPWSVRTETPPVRDLAATESQQQSFSRATNNSIHYQHLFRLDSKVLVLGQQVWLGTGESLPFPIQDLWALTERPGSLTTWPGSKQLHPLLAPPPGKFTFKADITHKRKCSPQ